MDALLRPGVQLIRRLRVAGKFIAIGLLLLIPLPVSLSGGWAASSRDITFVQREREGLRLAVPLVQLTAVLAGRPGGADGATQLASAVAEVDAAEAVVGIRLGVHDAWLRLREDVLRSGSASSPADDTSSPTSASSPASAPTTRTLHLAQRFTELVAGASNLILDPALDSYYVMIALVDRLPGVLEAVALHEQRRSGAGAGKADPMLQDMSERLQLNLRTAASTSGGAGLPRAVSDSYTALRTALTPYLVDTAPTSTAPTSTVPTSTVPTGSAAGGVAAGGVAAGGSAAGGAGQDLATVTAAGSALAGSLGSALDLLLRQRQAKRAEQRLRPLLLVAVALSCAGYLALALYRATTRDVGTVLTEINRVANGEFDWSEPLTGRDEFAEMSRAVKDSSDRLTELLSALRLQATYDELTALPNRTMFMAKVEDSIAERPGSFAVVLADLERFKDINDSFGHGIGDRLLHVVSARFHRAAGRRNLVARLGGNEFAVLVYDATTIRDVQQVIARMQVALAEPVDIDGRQLHTRARMGIALHATGRPGAVELIRNADVALSAAKGRDGVVVTLFEPAMHERTRDRTELSGDLVTAVAEQQFSLVYQPIVNVASGAVQGVEALVRWMHPTRGPVSPAVFIPLAEASGQIVELGRWVLHESLRQLATWHRQFPDSYPLTMDVNLSADQLAAPGLPGEVLTMISRTGVDPRRVVLEITETALVRNVETVRRRLGQLSAIGVRLALDDFGTGYSSLSYLRRLPVNVLKVDKSFVDGIDSPDGQAARLLHDIVGLGAGLGMEVIAEGIESPEQVPVLRAVGCNLGQGYLWSRPISADEVAELLHGGGRLPVSPLALDDVGVRTESAG